MLNILIFSKDRACQLELLLRSMAKHFDGIEKYRINVLFIYTNDEFKEGYQELTTKYIPKNLNVDFHYERIYGFKAGVLRLIDPGNAYTMFAVDDNVFKAHFSLDSKEFERFASDDKIACLSPRMYPGINYCYTARLDSPAPTFDEPGVWRWAGYKGDWSYPMSIDTHVFRTKDIMPHLLNLDYKNPNTLEGHMANRCLSATKMICFQEAKVMNLPINKVQTANGNHCGNISAEFLNQQFLSGKTIYLLEIEETMNTAPHQEVDIQWVVGNDCS